METRDGGPVLTGPDERPREAQVTERRYTEAEMAEIFRRATREGETESGPGKELALPERGFTLRELEEIGAEAGIPAEAVRQSALGLTHAGGDVPLEHVRRVMGAPVGVGTTSRLARPLTDDEFHRMVSLLRDTFHAQGKVTVEGRYRQWKNGNLTFALEPDGTGEKLRMSTRKSDGEALAVVGVALAGLGGFLAFMMLFASPDKAAKLIPLVAGNLAIGGVTFTVAQLRVRKWAGERLEQMKDIGRRMGIVAAEETDRLGPGEGT
jgi:hypothetical protein